MTQVLKLHNRKVKGPFDIEEAYLRKKLKNWINSPSKGTESFTTLHFVIYNGNL